jgi:hypothetical protein
VAVIHDETLYPTYAGQPETYNQPEMISAVYDGAGNIGILTDIWVPETEDNYGGNYAHFLLYPITPPPEEPDEDEEPGVPPSPVAPGRNTAMLLIDLSEAATALPDY